MKQKKQKTIILKSCEEDLDNIYDAYEKGYDAGMEYAMFINNAKRKILKNLRVE